MSRLTSNRTAVVATLLSVVVAGFVLLMSSKARTAPTSFMYMGQKITYERSGSGSTVILVPGIFRGRTEYAQVAQALMSSHDVVTFDLLGQGQSACPDINYDAYTQVEVLTALIASLSITKPHLVGFGEGATVVAHYAAANPTKVKSVALLSAMDVEFYDAMKNPINVNTAPPGTPGALYKRFYPPTAVTEAFGALAVVLASSPKSPMVNPNNAQALFLANLNGGCYYGTRTWDKNRMNSWFTLQEGMALSSANVPTALMFGDSDQLLDSNYQGAWTKAIGNAKTVSVSSGSAPSCGHDFINECPSQAATALNTFFSANGG